VDKLKSYRILYTYTAKDDIMSKAEYIENKFHDSNLAYSWYQNLKAAIESDLSFLPCKYQLYDHSPWKEQNIRELILQNDIVLYSVDEESASVIIHAVFTRGKNLFFDSSD
jgi:nicotinamide mononucleotide adenylyltransferase